jgi:hypothetical protein
MKKGTEYERGIFAAAVIKVRRGKPKRADQARPITKK